MAEEFEVISALLDGQSVDIDELEAALNSTAAHRRKRVMRSTPVRGSPTDGVIGKTDFRSGILPRFPPWQ